MTTIYLVNKKGDLVTLEVMETPDEVWDNITWIQPEGDYYDEGYQKVVFNKEFMKLTLINYQPIIINKRFIYYVE